MNSLDRIPERALARDVRDGTTVLAELKAAQRLGSLSVLTERVFTSDTYDADIVGTGSRKLHKVEIEFIPDDTTFGGAFAHRCLVKGFDASGTPVRMAQAIERWPSSDGRQRWTFYYETLSESGLTRRLKFYVFATGYGTLDINVVT